MWQCSESQWVSTDRRHEASDGYVSCCDDEDCLREHVFIEHGAVLEEVLGSADAMENAFCYYLEALAVKERQGMPIVGFSVDRRVFTQVRKDLSDEAVQALMCACCNCIKTYRNGNAEIAYINAYEYFNSGLIIPESCSWN